MVACFRLGAIVLPCNEQLRAKAIRLRLDAAKPKVIVTDERNANELPRPAQTLRCFDPRRLAVRLRPTTARWERPLTASSVGG
jgi:acyl-coenzyme A synthetase/AMP-(fatty) acid ligase